MCPPFAIIVGVPGMVLRYRFDSEIRAALLRIAWWDWPQKKLARHQKEFRELGAKEFCRHHDPEA